MLGFFVLEAKADVNITQETQTKNKQLRRKYSKRTQRDGFLNRYDFAMLVKRPSTRW